MSKKIAPYGQTFTLIQPLTNVECWNCTNGAVGTFNVGEQIKVLHCYDATHTTCLCTEENGRTVYLDGKPMLYDKTGDPVMGYRFIVPNLALGIAIGVDMPHKTADIIGDLIDVECGTGSQKQARRVAKALKGTPLGAKFKQRYVRN